MTKKIIIIFLFWKILLLFLTYLIPFFVPLKTTFDSGKFGQGLPYLFWVWGNFDGYHYMEIAQRGYHNLEQGFFPLYPILIRLFSTFFGTSLIISGQIITNFLFLSSLFIIYKLLVNDKKEKLFSLLLLIMIFFPTSLFYGAVYNDSLFLFLAVLTIYFATKKNWFLSSMSGMFATLARLNGLTLFFFILFEYINSNNKNSLNEWNLNNFLRQCNKNLNFKEIMKSKLYYIFLIPLSFVGYLFYIDIIFDSWKTLFSSMKVWGQDKLTFPLQVFWRYFKIIILHPTFHINYWVAVFELFMVIFYIFLLFYSFKKIRLSYWVLFALSILIPSLTGTFQGMPRYGLHLYPMYLSLSLFLKSSGLLVKIVYFIISFLLLIFCLAFFTRGYFIA